MLYNKFFQQLKKGRLGGHPIHSMLIHFPSALFPMVFVFDLLALLFRDQGLVYAAFYSLAFGILTSFAAAFFGVIDYARIPSKHVAWGKASLHGLLNIIWIMLFSILFGLRARSYPNIEFASVTGMVFCFVGVVGLIFSNYLGGELIFKHKLGFDEEDAS